MATLLLFDIDGTLLHTGGAGGAAIFDAAETLFGADRQTLPELQLAGATDSGILRDLFTGLQQPLSFSTQSAFLEEYLRHLHKRLHQPDFSGSLLPKVYELITSLHCIPSLDLALLTGNVRRGAELKLSRFELDTYFLDGAFGDDAEDRNLLGPIALRRMAKKTAKSYSSDDIIVIGDTPKDIACAHALGARCLAVATGQYSVAELEHHQPWKVLPDFSDLSHTQDLLLS